MPELPIFYRLLRGPDAGSKPMVSDPLGSAGAAPPLGFILVATPQLRALVARQQELLPAEEFGELVANIRSAFDKYSVRLRSAAPGVERAATLHALLERELAAAGQLPVTCKKGCCACCHYEVEITSDEAKLLRELVRAGTLIDGLRLDLQAARERKSPAWTAVLSSDNRCVFLGEDGACRVYEHRPSICRKHLVTSDPAACAHPGPEVAQAQILLAEIVLSASMSLEGTTTGSLPRMLQQALREV
jgi:uncharacterized protein